MNTNELVCLGKGHTFQNVTGERSLDQRCSRCGRVEIKHFHPRRNYAHIRAAVPVPIVIAARKPVCGQVDRKFLNQW
jgi:hypothetical protein